jgi:hypothetical protein
VVGDTAVRVRIRVLERTFGGLRRRAPEDVGFDVVAPAVEPYMVGESMDDALRDV